MSETDSQLEARLIQIETMLAHVQQDVDDINKSLTRHFQRLHEFEERFTRIEHEIEVMHQEPEKRDPQVEKPPHY
jgi:uncharacterized coiled-coil protein SlyX